MVRLCVLWLLLPGAGCSDAHRAGLTTPSSVASLRLSSQAVEVGLGEAQQIDVHGVTSTGSTVSLTNVEWTVPPGVALTGSGSTVTLRGTSIGHGLIVARASGLADSATIDVVPAPPSSAHLLLDLRQSLQQATTIDQAFALFGTIDHTPYRGARNSTGGWSFTTNADGTGLHALRADWTISSADQRIMVIDYLPAPKPTDLYVQWKGRLGKFAADADANGTDNSYAMFPQSNSCKRALFVRPDNSYRIDYTLSRNLPEDIQLEMGDFNYLRTGNPAIWNINSEVGAPPFTTTVHVRAASANGVNDGVFQLWINGTLVMDQHDLPAMAEPIDRWQFPDNCTVVPQPQAEYFWDILAWTP